MPSIKSSHSVSHHSAFGSKAKALKVSIARRRNAGAQQCLEVEGHGWPAAHPSSSKTPPSPEGGGTNSQSGGPRDRNEGEAMASAVERARELIHGRWKVWLASAVLAIAAWPAPSARAQAVYGSIAGTVTDSTGAVMPGATATITSIERKTGNNVT